MAGERKITVQFDGEDVGLGSAASKAADDLDGLEVATDGVAKKSMTAGEKLTALVGVASGGAIAFMGFQDASEGVSKALHGDFSGMDKVMQGMEGMGAGMALLVASIPEQVTTWVVGHATMAASALASFASQIAEWVVLAATSLASAASVAMAWLISVAPIALVIAAVVALVVIIVKNWDTIKRITVEVFTAIWDFIKGAIDSQIELFKKIPGWIGSALSGLADVFLKPFRDAFNGIKEVWNSTVGGKGFSVPSWIPGIGGKSFTIPKLHTGGVFNSGMGEGLALLQDGETVLPAGVGVGGIQRLHITSDDSRVGRVLLDLLRKEIVNIGGATAAFG
jgi:hypothetical protein